MLQLGLKAYIEDFYLIKCYNYSNTCATAILAVVVRDELQDLPSSRGFFDHRIPLKEGTLPIDIRPYMYPLRTKDIIE